MPVQTCIKKVRVPEEAMGDPGGHIPHVCIILVNWNGWRDTIECLESVFRMDYPQFSVIVCDNDSSDRSMEHIEQWARGDLAASSSNLDMHRLTYPPISKPIAFSSLELLLVDSLLQSNRRLQLVRTGANLGFAGGSNVGIRHALARSRCDYVWLLNNDTVVEPAGLSAMVSMANEKKMAICGSVLRAYAPPHPVLTAGGRRYSKWTGRTQAITEPNKRPQMLSDYVEGASMLISRRCLEQVGLLEESYFLYFEELDLVSRLPRNASIGYATGSVVYHKEGASIGSSVKRANRSVLSEFYLARNRILFSRRHHPWYVPLVLVATVASSLQRAGTAKLANASAILRGVWSGLGANAARSGMGDN